MSADNDDGRVAGSFTFQAQMPNGKTLSFAGYLLAGQTTAEINRHLDQAAAAVERQRLIAEIPTLEISLKQKRQAREQMESALEDLAAKERPTAQEKNSMNTFRVNLKRVDSDIDEGVQAIQDARQLAA